MSNVFIEKIYNKINYVTYKDYVKKCNIYELWNQEYGDTYLISNEMFRQNTLENRDVYSEGSYICLNENSELIGFIIIQLCDKEEYEHNSWINLMYVKPEYRMQGIGKKLLHLSEEKLRKINKKNLRLGAGYHPYFPGLPKEIESEAFFKKEGFDLIKISYDLIGTFTKCIELEKNELSYRYATPKDDKEFSDFLKNNFGIRWYYEWKDYLEFCQKNKCDYKEYIVLIKNNIIIGFVRKNSQSTKEITHNTNWKHNYDFPIGGVGPLGILSEERGNGYGLEVVRIGMNELISNGTYNIRIDWTRHVDFYSKLGFNIEKQYKFYNKNI